MINYNKSDLSIAMNFPINNCRLCKKDRLWVEDTRAIRCVLHVTARITARTETAKDARDTANCADGVSKHKVHISKLWERKCCLNKKWQN